MKYATLVLFLLLSSCQFNSPGMVDAASTYTAYGAEITPEAALPAEALVAELDMYVGRQVKVESEIVEVCQHKGCWLTLDTGLGVPIRVDVPRTDAGAYEFVVPTDIGRRRAIVSGMLIRKALSEEERTHLQEESESGTAIPPTPQLHITATGILVEKTPPAS